MVQNQMNKYKFCGMNVGKKQICSGCYAKLTLIRKLLKTVRDMADGRYEKCS